MTAVGLHEWLAEALEQPLADPACLRKRLARQQSPLWLMLDDVPLGADAEFDDALIQLIQHSSTRVGWWIGTRRRPAWPLARLLLAGELCELGAAELALDGPEIQQVLDASGDHALLPQGRELLALTGGWYAGVRLKLLEAANVRYGARGAGGCLIRSYVERELLDPLTFAQRETLCALACLPRFDAELCAFVLEAEGAAVLIGELQGAGAFIEVLDPEAGVYRVQPTVARALVDRLEGVVRRALHRRACQHYSAYNLVSEAIEHALLAGEHDVAASLLERLPLDQLLDGHGLASIRRWREQLPVHLMSSTPWLVILNAWSLLLSGNLDEAGRMAGRLAKFLPQSGSTSQGEVLAEWQVLAGVIACRQGQCSVGRLMLEDGLRSLPERAWAQRGLADGELIDLAYAEMRNEESQVLRRDAIKLVRMHDCLALEVRLVLNQVRLLTTRGELGRAYGLLQRLEGELDGTSREQARQLAAHILLHRAEVLNAKGDRSDATASFLTAVGFFLECGDPAAILGLISLAELHALDGEFADAYSRLADAERMMHRQEVDEFVYHGRLTLARGNLRLCQRRFDQAMNLANGWLCDSTMDRAVQSELAIRFELLQGRARQAMGEAVTDDLEQLLACALRHGWKTVACEILMALAEAHHGEGRRRKAQSTLLDGLALARQVGMTRIDRFITGGNSVLAGWVSLTGNCYEESSAVAEVVQLSRREIAVLQLIAGGLANLEIANYLHISLHTVKSHAHRINVKLGVSRRTQAILRAKDLGLVN